MRRQRYYSRKKKGNKLGGLIFLMLILLPVLVVICFKKQDQKNISNKAQLNFLKNRLNTIQTLTYYTNMHLDDAVSNGYQETLDIIASIHVETENYYWVLGRLYYAAANMFLESTYIPSILNSVQHPDDQIIFDKDSIPEFLNISPKMEKEEIINFPKPLYERENRLYQLKKRYEIFKSAYENGEIEVYIKYCAFLQNDFLNALIFYLQMNQLLSESEIFQLEDIDRQKHYLEILENSDYDMLSRYLATTIFHEKLFFNILTTFYYKYCFLSEKLPEMDFLQNSAQKMDFTLMVQNDDSFEYIFNKLSLTAGVIDSMTIRVIETLKQADLKTNVWELFEE